MTATDWTPDQPLRADVTDEQIIARHNRQYYQYGDSDVDISVRVARELQEATKAATVAEYEAKLAALGAENVEFLEVIWHTHDAQRALMRSVWSETPNCICAYCERYRETLPTLEEIRAFVARTPSPEPK